MTLLRHNVHPRSLDTRNLVKAVVLRKVHHLSFEAIAGKVRNLKGEHPSKNCVRESIAGADKAQVANRKFNYKRCGRTAYKLPSDVVDWLVRRLRCLRRRVVCTSSVLQRELAQEKGIRVTCRQIRRKLNDRGYYWLPRDKKPKLSRAKMLERLVFADAVLAMTEAELEDYVHFAMDGVVLACPPREQVARRNHCHYDDNCVYRKRGELVSGIGGADDYAHQIPAERAVPMWAGIAKGGFAVVTFHAGRKLNQTIWADLVRKGILSGAIKSLWPANRRGPWRVLCDNETFLNARLCRPQHARRNIVLWQVPAKSPDLNPVEKYWSYLRRRLRDMDLDDLAKGKPAATKTQYRRRIRSIGQTQGAKRVARNLIKGLRNVCLQVRERRGARSSS